MAARCAPGGEWEDGQEHASAGAGALTCGVPAEEQGAEGQAGLRQAGGAHPPGRQEAVGLHQVQHLLGVR